METKAQRIVCILKNTENPPRCYTGLTCNLKARLEHHNAGRCAHTAMHRPWPIDVVVKLADELRARNFEKCLKSRSCAGMPRRSPKGEGGLPDRVFSA